MLTVILFTLGGLFLWVFFVPFSSFALVPCDLMTISSVIFGFLSCVCVCVTNRFLICSYHKVGTHAQRHTHHYFVIYLKFKYILITLHFCSTHVSCFLPSLCLFVYPLTIYADIILLVLPFSLSTNFICG